jgi:hypothetical protein
VHYFRPDPYGVVHYKGNRVPFGTHCCQFIFSPAA